MGQMFETCFKMDPYHDFKLLTSLGVMASSISYLLRPKPYKITDKLKTRMYKLSIMEHILGTLLIMCTIINIVIRVAKGVPHWLCQPCHILSFFLIYVLYFSDLDTRMFHYYFYSMWMPVIGLLSPPNSEWFTWWWEIYVFYIHHILLLMIPYYYLTFNHRFHPHLRTKTSSHPDYEVPHITDKSSRFKYFNHIFCFGVIYHAFFLTNLGLYLDEDFDALRCRFAGGEIFDIYWREALMTLCYIDSIIFAWIPDHFAHKYFQKKEKELNSKEHANHSKQE